MYFKAIISIIISISHLKEWNLHHYKWHLKVSDNFSVCSSGGTKSTVAQNMNDKKQTNT